MNEAFFALLIVVLVINIATSFLSLAAFVYISNHLARFEERVGSLEERGETHETKIGLLESGFQSVLNYGRFGGVTERGTGGGPLR